MTLKEKDIYKKIGLKWVKCCLNCIHKGYNDEDHYFCNDATIQETFNDIILLDGDTICASYEMEGETKFYIKQFDGEIL